MQYTRHHLDNPAQPRLPLPALGLPLAEPAQRISLTKGYDGLDKERLRSLIEAGFGHALAPAYFDSKADSVIIGGDYEGVAIIKTLCGLPYLDKFVVHPESQGKGLGGEIWKTIKALNPSLLWRASQSNPCNCWYERNSDGSERRGEWVVYWYNVEPVKAAEAAIAAAGLPKTIIRD